MKKMFKIAIAALVPVLGLGVTVMTADAATVPAVTITGAYYDSPGSDTRSNASLNAEWIRLTNNTSKAISLKGWTLRDKQNHVYTFASYNLGAHKYVMVRTGKGTNGKPASTDRYWGSGNYIWNNTGDTATVKNNKAKVIDTCTWPNNGGHYTAC